MCTFISARAHVHIYVHFESAHVHFKGAHVHFHSARVHFLCSKSNSTSTPLASTEYNKQSQTPVFTAGSYLICNLFQNLSKALLNSFSKRADTTFHGRAFQLLVLTVNDPHRQTFSLILILCIR